MAGCVGGGVERRHLQKARDAGGFGGPQGTLSQFGVRAAKTAATESALVQDADQIDDHVLATEALGQFGRVIHVAILERETGQHQHVLVLFAVARQHGDAMAILDQPADQPGSQEAAAAEHADRHRPHGVSVSG